MDRTLAELRDLLADLAELAPESGPGGRGELEGREKFVRRRKRRRVQHLLKRADREDLLAARAALDRPLFRVREGDGTARVVVTHADPTVTVDGTTVRVRAGDAQRTVSLSFAPSVVERTVNNGVTTLRFS